MSASLESSLTPDGHASGWFAAAIFATGEAFGIRLTESRIRIYATELSDLCRSDIETALARCRRDGQFFPQMAEVRKQIHGSLDDAGILAWNTVMQAAARVGSYSSIEFEDPTIAAAVVRTFGSWPAVCALEAGPESHVKRQEFLAALREARRELTTMVPVRLSGLLESSSHYERRPSVWTARLCADGLVVHEREHPALVSGSARPQLPEGRA